MIAEPKFYDGGGGAILTILSQTDAAYDETGEINRLILDCARSKESLSKLYVMFKSSVFAVSFSITSDFHLAEDCVIETFVRLTQVKNFNPKKGDGKGYILKVARNVALELRRRQKREFDDFFIQSYGEADKTVEDSIYINQMLKVLSDTQRQIVVMRCCSGLTFKEIARIMTLPESTVKSRYKKAMTILQEKAGVSSEK